MTWRAVSLRPSADSRQREWDYAVATSDWYAQYPDDELPLVAYCSVSCVCRRCLQADFNASVGLPLRVKGL